MERCGQLAEGSDECLTHPGRNFSVLKDSCNGLIVGSHGKEWPMASYKKLTPANLFHAIVRLLYLLTPDWFTIENVDDIEEGGEDDCAFGSGACHPAECRV